MSWQELKNLIQSLDEQHKGRKKGEPFEELVAELLGALLEDRFETAKSGYQPIGDAINEERTIVLQTKNYNDETPLDRKEILGDIEEAELELPNLQTYVLAASRTIGNRLRNRFGDIEKKTGLDIVSLELTDQLSNLGALCVTFWEDIRGFFDSSDICQGPNFLAWIEEKRENSETEQKIKQLRLKLKQGIQTQKHVQKDIEKHLIERFSRDQGFNPINLSQAIERESLESKIMDWWTDHHQPVCCLEGKEGHGKSWLAAKGMTLICENDSVVAFWLDSKDWSGHKSIFDLLHTCFSLIYPSYEQRKIAKLQSKPAKIWRKTLIVLDGVNEREALETADRILSEYFRHENEWGSRIRFLLTTRPLDDYPDLWSRCHKISVDPFNDSERQKALILKGLQPNDLPNSLKDTASIPRYFERCLELRDELGSFAVVTPEMVLLADLADKIKRSDQQIKQKLGWIRPEDPKDFFSNLAKQIEWDKVDAAPERLGKLLKGCFFDYSKIRSDLEEQRIVSKAGLYDAKLSADYVLLCWTLYLSNLFDNAESTGIEDLLENFQQELEPILSEDLRTEALFAALQLSAIFPNTDLSQEQLSQKRAALMLAWFHSHNAQITNERLLFWAEKDPDAYAQVVEFEFEDHDSSNYEDALIKPLAKTWLNKKGDLNRLASCLTKWFLPTYTEEPPKDPFYIHITGQRFPRGKDDIQFGLLDAAVSILSQRPERQFLKTLARCYGTLYSNERFNSDIGIGRRLQFHERIGRLMRWGYTEEVVGDLHWLAELAQANEILLRGVYGLADCLRVDLRPRLQRPLSEKELETRAFLEEDNRRFKPYIDRIRNQERLLIGDSPAANGNYHGLNYLAVRTDLPDWHHEDIVEIKKILQDVSVNAELGQTRAPTHEGFCIENLMPWVARYDPESYAELSCNLKINTLNQEWAQIVLSSIQGLIFKPETCTKITEAILEMKHRLVQAIQTDNSSSDTIYLTSLLTETLLFSAPEEKLTEWFEFLALHEPLRGSICYEPLPYLLEQLLPKSIVELARQKLETLGPGTTNDESMSNEGSEELPEREYWRVLYVFGAQTDEELVTWALKELKMRKSDLTAGTYILMLSALSDPKRFLDEILNSKKIRKHLFHENSRRSIVPIYEGKDVPSYETLAPVVPPEIVGSFLCSSDRSDDLSRWGRELMAQMCSILQGVEADFNSVKERRFEVNREILQIWAEQNTIDFLQLAKAYLTELSKFPRYSQALSHFTDDIRCLLLRFEPDKAKQHYHQWNAESFKTVYRTHYGVDSFLAQLWKVEHCNSLEHRQLRHELLEECLNDEEIMFMTLTALAEGGQDELWSLVKNEYLESHYAKERNLGVSILPWFGTCEAIKELKRLKSSDQSQWVREHAAWAYEVAQQEHSCREVYRKALQTRDPFRVSAVFEQIKPALSPTAKSWHYQIEEDEQLYEESQSTDPKLLALIERFWYRWGKSPKTKRNIEVFGRKLGEYCRGERFLAGQYPRIAPWWKPTSNFDS